MAWVKPGHVIEAGRGRAAFQRVHGAEDLLDQTRVVRVLLQGDEGLLHDLYLFAGLFEKELDLLGSELVARHVLASLHDAMAQAPAFRPVSLRYGPSGRPGWTARTGLPQRGQTPGLPAPGSRCRAAGRSR